MKILLDCRFRKGAGANVTTRYLVEAILKLDRNNDYVIVQHRHQELADGRRVARIIVPTQKRWAEFFWVQVVLPRILRREGVDLYHSLKHFGPLFTGVKTILMNRAVTQFIGLDHKLSRTDRFYWTVVGRMAWRRADRIAAISSVCRKVLIERLGIDANKIQVIFHGLNARFRPVEDASDSAARRQRYHLPERYLLCIGNLYHHKNHATVIRALGVLRREGVVDHRCSLVVVGEPAEASGPLARLIQELDLGEAVQMPGFIGHTDLPAVYHGAEVFLFPSLHEAFGNPLVEAMACGVPVVAADRGAVAEVTAGAALLVAEAQNPEAFAQAIKSVLCDSKKRGTMIAAGLRRAADFSWEATARQFLDLYAALGAELQNVDEGG